jgi:hypothetical protein
LLISQINHLLTISSKCVNKRQTTRGRYQTAQKLILPLKSSYRYSHSLLKSKSIDEDG